VLLYATTLAVSSIVTGPSTHHFSPPGWGEYDGVGETAALADDLHQPLSGPTRIIVWREGWLVTMLWTGS
jgi:hypothetical protein